MPPRRRRSCGPSHSNLAGRRPRPGTPTHASRSRLSGRRLRRSRGHKAATRRLSESEPRVPAHLAGLVGGRGNLGGLQESVGRLDDAEASYRGAIEAGERLVRAFPAERTGRLFLAKSHMNLAELLLRTRGAA